MSKIRNFVKEILPKGGWKIPAIIIVGAFVGLFIYAFTTSRSYSYLSDKPEVCVNCHIMAPYYATWFHGSHGRDATCNDCHVPHDNIVNKYYFKAKDGLRHAAIFTLRAEPQAIIALDASSEVIMDNCIRCHTQLNQEFVETGRMGFKDTKKLKGNACWDCHRDVPHTRSRSLSATSNQIVPMPETNVPKWIESLTK